MRAIVIQPGARHGYALPRFLHNAGALQRLYTDFAIAEGSVEHAILRSIGSTRTGQKLARRVVNGIPAASICRFSPSALLSRNSTPARDNRWNFLARDLREADLIYSQYFAGGEQLDELTAHGARLVSDVFIMPSAHRIDTREALRFPEWGEAPVSPELAAHYDAISLAMMARSDALFCPSQSVIDDVADYMPAARAKCRLVRYGSSLSFPEPNRPFAKRVLFAGSLQLRKGVQYLAAAAARIAAIDPDIHFVLAGIATPQVAAQLRRSNVQLLGHLSRQRLREEFLCADVFAFPSLAEGSAGVVLEAMAAGVPIVATREAGVDFADGESGIVVPPTDVEALVAAILRIVSNRPLRAAMAASARAEFIAYDDAAWAASFVGGLRDVLSHG